MPQDVQGRVVAVIDVLRASTTIAVALSNGARAIIPMESPDDAVTRSKQLERGAFLLAGEQKRSSLELLGACDGVVRTLHGNDGARAIAQGDRDCRRRAKHVDDGNHSALHVLWHELLYAEQHVDPHFIPAPSSGPVPDRGTWCRRRHS